MELSNTKEAASCTAAKELEHFMEFQGSLRHSQQPCTGPFAEPDKSSMHKQSLSLQNVFNTINPSTYCVFPNSFLTNNLLLKYEQGRTWQEN
jgi:hypothetical protein